MRNNKGLTLVALVITIIVLLILAGVSIRFILGDNGVLKKANTVDETFDKSEVLEEINVIITEKYLDAYNKSIQNGVVSIDKFYNGEKVIEFLKGHSGGPNGDDYETLDSKVYIEDLAGVDNSTAEEKCYFIIISSLNRKVENYGKGKNEEGANDIFYIKGSEDSYKVFYRNLKGEDIEVGNVQLQQSL